MGVDHIGVLVGEGEFPREQPVQRTAEIFTAVEAPSRSIALSLSPNLQAITRLVAALRPSILHLGAAPDLLRPSDVAALRASLPPVEIMRSIPVIDEASIGLAREYDGLADFLLLDSYDPGDHQIGALGVTHSWELDRRIVEAVRLPVIIAGGLGPHNVRAAIRTSHPAGVDSKTATDKPDRSHTKDLDKVRAFVGAASRTE